MIRKKSSLLCLVGLALFVSLIGLGGCTHGSDDTGGNSSMGSMSGTTDRQYTQSNANQAGPAGGSAANNSTGGVSAGGSGTSGASMGTAGSGRAGGAESTPPTGGSK